MRKEVIGDATLYLGDCREIEVAHDLLVTDPPYGQGYKSGRTDEWGAIKGDDDLAGVEERLAHVLKGSPQSRMQDRGGSVAFGCSAARPHQHMSHYSKGRKE